jgi:hypothetical protein
VRFLAILICAFAIPATATAMTTDGVHDNAAAIAATPDGLPPAGPDAPSCPSIPASDTPRQECPFDPATYYLWPGDDQDAPLWTRCNYDSGDANNPCPHSHIGDQPWYFRCGRGTDPDTAGTVGIEFAGPETDPVAQADVTAICSGSWESLSAPVGGDDAREGQ